MSPVTPSWAIKAFGNILSQKGEKKKGKEKNKRQHELKKKKKRGQQEICKLSSNAISKEELASISDMTCSCIL